MNSKDIENAFKYASKKAGDTAMANGRNIVVKQGRKLVKINPNGDKTVIRTLDKAYVHCDIKKFKMP